MVEFDLLAGFRASPYGTDLYPREDYWTQVGSEMASRFEGAVPGGIWILGVIIDNGVCKVNFPSPGGDFPDVDFRATDGTEYVLEQFDQTGVKVWLQVEPGDADILMLIDLVLDRYKHHPSVIGFGIDGEWYRSSEVEYGVTITNEEAQAWSEAVRAFDPTYTLMLKHFNRAKLPTKYREGLFFIDDSQSLSNLNVMVGEFRQWGDKFKPAPVGFQIGYGGDREWWGEMSDPPAELGQALIDAIPNNRGIFWVDFTIDEVFPPQ